MIRFRSFRNGDPPALADLWNRGLPERGVVRPLGPHEFDAMVIGRLEFDREGLILAEDDGRAVGFAHAGFGPDLSNPRHRPDYELGTVAMLVLDPDRDDPALGRDLFAAAESYLVGRGAKVLYAGMQYPLNPFYWGIYGGSESGGILGDHESMRRAATDSGYEEVSTMVLLDVDLTVAEARDPKAAILRRQARVEIEEEAMPADWWEASSIGHSQITHYRLVSKADEVELARASAWDMAAFGRLDGRARTGLTAIRVEPEHRRKGYARHLIAEILRHVKGQWGEVVSVQTGATNRPALALYFSLGFEPVESAILFRKPGGRGG